MPKTENEPVKSKRELFAERMKGRYPDIDVNDDEAFFGKISEDYDDYDKKLSGFQEREKAFSDMFTADPRSAAFLMDWKDGEDPVVALVRRFGVEIKDAIDDPERQEAIAEANKEFLARVTKSRELEEEYNKNEEATYEAIEQFKKEKGYSDKEIDAAFTLLQKIHSDILIGKVDPASIEMAIKAINHDADVDEATQAGIVQGKNTKIDEKLRQKKGDGTHATSGKAGGIGPTPPKKSLGALDNFGDGNKNIWERGNEQRRKA